MGPGYEGNPICDGVEEAGGEVARVDASQDYPNEYILEHDLPHPTRESDYHIFCARKSWGGYCDSEKHAKRLVYGFEHVKVKKLLREIPQVDAVLITQPVFQFDVSGVNVPVFYYLTRASRLWWPKGRVTGFFYGYRDLYYYFKEHRPNEIFNLELREFIPPGYDPEFYYPEASGNDQIELGFMGTRKRHNDWFSQQLYILRNFYLDYARDHLGATICSVQNPAEYKGFLQSCNLALNISVCGANMRQFEAPACGAVLVQLQNQDSGVTGLKDKENCLLFRNEKELTEKVNWALKDWEELEKIRVNGMEYARGNTFQARGKTIFKAITNLYLKKDEIEQNEVTNQEFVDVQNG